MLVLMLTVCLGATAAYAATCVVTAGPGGDGSGTMTTLQIMNDGGTKAIWNPLLANASSATNNPGRVCGAPWNGFNSYARFRKTTGLYKSLNQAGFVVQFADGATLTRNGGDYMYTPAAGASGVKALSGPVTILALGSINGGSVDANDVAVGETGTFDGYAGGVNDAQATTATGGTFDISVTIAVPAAISGISPTSGPVAGGAGVTIAGMGFGTSGNSVSFGGTAAAITAQSSTAITVTSPPHPVGAVTVVVTTSDAQTATATNGYTYVAAPTIASLAPALGITAGGAVVTVTGTNLGNVTSLTVDGTAVTVGANSATGFTFTTPAHVAAVVAVIATTAGGSATTSFTYADPPTLTTVAPAAGPLAGGNAVVLTGSNFTATGTIVTFGAAAAAVTFNSATQVSVTAPSGTGTVNVTVATAGGSATKIAAYSYAQAPTLTQVAPVSGPIAGGTAMTLTGTNFTAGSVVMIGGLAATTIIVVDPQTITATSPAHAAGAVGVAVTAAGGTATLASGFTYVAVPVAPVVTAPNTGVVQTTTTPVVTGTAIANAIVTIYLNGTQAGQVVASAGGAWSFTPGVALPQGVNTVHATASNAGGTSANSTSNSFTIDSVAPAAPVVTTPTNGATIGTTTPTILGTAEATALVTLTIDGGAGATTSADVGGNWSYTTGVLTRTAHTVAATARDAAGNVSSTSGISTFTIATPPIVTSVSPILGTTAGGSAVTIVGANFIGATGVTFAGSSAGFTVGSDTQITATTPAGSAGAAVVRVTNAAGPGSVDGSYTYVAPPVAMAQVVATPFDTAVAITLAATNAPTSYTVTTGPLHGSVSGAAPTLTYTPDTTYRGTDNIGFTATNGGGTSLPATIVITVNDPTLTLTGTPPPGASGTAYAFVFSTGGGTAPYSYAVTAGALPAGLTLTPTGTLSGTPSASGSFPLTVIVTDSTPGLPPITTSANVTIAIAAPALTLAPAVLANGAVGAAYSQALTASGGTAPYAYAVTAGALPAGLTLSASGTLAGTPSAGGSFALTVTATDATAAGSGGPYTASASYTLGVTVPSVTLAPTSLPAATAGVAYSQTLTASGGTAPYAYAVTAGALPAGLTLSATGTLAGSPLASGSFALSITATDASSGSGPYATTRSYTVVVAAPALTLAPAVLANGAVGAAYSQALTASGGTAPYSYAITAGALPAGLTLGATGQITGTPTAAGRFTVSITATDASSGNGPYSASLTYILAIAPPPAPVAADAPARNIPASTLATPQPSTIDLSSLVTGAVTDIQIIVQPEHGVATLASTGVGSSIRFIATYTPMVGFSGDDAFAYIAVGPGGRSAAARVALTVVGAVPIAVAVRSTTISGQSVIVDLTVGATNGPFIAAQVLAISPINSVVAELIEGGTATNRLYQLRITPEGRFSGTATIQYAISNAFGVSAPALVTIAVAARPDPSQDPDVRAISAAQAEAIRRFASAQTDNFMRRTEELHGDGAASQRSPFGITMNGIGLGRNGGVNGDSYGYGYGGGYGGGYAGGRADTSPAESDVAMLKMEHATEVIGAERGAGLLSFERGTAMNGDALAGGRYRMPSTANRGQTEPRSNSDPTFGEAIGGNASASGESGRAVGSIAPWSGGAVSFGTRDQTRRRAKLSVTTAGLSAGVDVKLADGITLGAGGGYGADRTKIGSDTGRVDGDSWVGVVYGSIAPADGLFFDGVFGAGRLAFDTRRTIVANGSVGRGHREGSMLFGSLASGYDRTTDRWSLSAYGRADFLSANLDDYAETGGGIYGLAFAKRDVTSLAGILGLRGAVAVGALTPRIRVEWRHEFRDGGVQALDYTGLPGFGYRIEGDQWLRDAFRVELGGDLRVGNGWRLGTEVGGAFGQGAASAMARVIIGKQF